ncbi:MAG: DNA polymerase III subunit [Clostridia bacterium]|nr:DNA polymerase III subunit [Clostridia bacterium]
MFLKGFYGNRETKEQLAAAFDSGRVPHALLIEGPEGCGKKTLAKLLAAACVCSAEDPGRPCGVCRHCVKAASGNHPDIRLVSGGAGARSFPVDAVRRVRVDAYVTPNEAMRKVYILTDIQNMTEQAQNALLKVLEEPPEYAVFILTCDSGARVLDTVRSRCRPVSVGPVSLQDTIAALGEQLPQALPAAAQRAAQLSGGNIGRAKAALGQEGFEKAASLADELADAVCSFGEYRLLSLSGKLEKDPALFTLFLSLLPLILRDAACAHVSGGEALSGCPEAAKKLGGALTLRQLDAMLRVSVEARSAVDRYANHTLLLTWLFTRLRAGRRV